MRKGNWENGIRQKWVDLSQEESVEYKQHLDEALSHSEEVEAMRQNAETEFNARKAEQIRK